MFVSEEEMLSTHFNKLMWHEQMKEIPGKCIFFKIIITVTHPYLFMNLLINLQNKDGEKSPC